MNTFEPLIDIDTLASELNLGKDRLRKWEQRYGFPSPVRREDGLRLYPADQVERLRKVARLLDTGARAGDVLPLSSTHPELQAEPAEPAPQNLREALAELSGQLEQLRATESATDGHSVSGWLTQKVIPLIERIGSTWAAGNLPIWAEHLLSEQLQRLLSQQLAQQEGVKESSPRALLCTQKRAPLIATLTQLRTALPNIEIWLGGSGGSPMRRLPEGVIAIRDLDQVRVQIRRWRREQRSV